MKVRQLHHASIRVADLERSRAFYGELLQMTPVARPELGFPGIWYGLGAGQLHLIRCEPMAMKIDPTGPHLAIAVDDLDEARSRLKAANLEVLDPGGDQLWVLDPDGYTIEITRASRDETGT